VTDDGSVGITSLVGEPLAVGIEVEGRGVSSSRRKGEEGREENELLGHVGVSCEEQKEREVDQHGGAW